jgi:hypothetical protein
MAIAAHKPCYLGPSFFKEALFSFNETRGEKSAALPKNTP